MSWAGIAAALTFVTTAVSVKQTIDAKKAGRRAEAAARAESDRSKAIQQKENEKLLSTARARAAASGTSGLSESVFLADLRKQGLEELDWLNTVGDFGAVAASSATDLAVSKGLQNTLGSASVMAQAFKGL